MKIKIEKEKKKEGRCGRSRTARDGPSDDANSHPLSSGPLRRLQVVHTSANHIAVSSPPLAPGKTKNGHPHYSLLHPLAFLQSHILCSFTGRVSK